MNNLVILIVAIVVIVAIAALVVWATQRRRSDELRRRFGPEYERTLETARDRGEAEKELRARQERVDALEIRPLQPAVRDQYAERWHEVQAMFVDDPGSAVEQADTLIGEVMRARGYPVGDFEQRAADISVNHPQVVDHYRTAHSIAVRRRSGDGATEQLRQAFVHYRALFADLLETPDSGDVGRAAARKSAPETASAPAASAPGASAPGASAPEPRLAEREAEAADATRAARREDVTESTGTAPPMTEPARSSNTTTIDTEEPVDPARRAR